MKILRALENYHVSINYSDTIEERLRMIADVDMLCQWTWDGINSKNFSTIRIGNTQLLMKLIPARVEGIIRMGNDAVWMTTGYRFAEACEALAFVREIMGLYKPDSEEKGILSDPKDKEMPSDIFVLGSVGSKILYQSDDKPQECKKLDSGMLCISLTKTSLPSQPLVVHPYIEEIKNLLPMSSNWALIPVVEEE